MNTEWLILVTGSSACLLLLLLGVCYLIKAMAKEMQCLLECSISLQAQLVHSFRPHSTPLNPPEGNEP